MQNSTFSARGCLTFWTPVEVSYGAIDMALRKVGFADCVPKPRTDDAALRTAMKATEGKTKDRLIQPRQKPKVNGVELVVVKRGDGHSQIRNDYITSYSAVVRQGVVKTDYGLADSSRLQEEYETAKAILPTSAVSSALVAVLEKLNGTRPLKPGIYWVPPESIEAWRGVEQALGDKGCGAASVVLGVCDTREPSLVREIVQALTQEVEEAADKIVERSLRGTVSVEQLDIYAKEAESLLEKIEGYEADLGISLKELQRLASVAKNRAVAAAVRAMPSYTPAFA